MSLEFFSSHYSFIDLRSFTGLKIFYIQKPFHYYTTKIAIILTLDINIVYEDKSLISILKAISLQAEQSVTQKSSNN